MKISPLQNKIERKQFLKIILIPIMNTKSVYLSFPYSTHCDELNKSFVLSYNDACKSDFLKVLLENEDHENNDRFHIVIPHNLYMDIRYVDIEYTIKLWTGKAYIPSRWELRNDTHYVYSDVARLCQAITLCDKIPFVNLLNKEYPPLCQQQES